MKNWAGSASTAPRWREWFEWHTLAQATIDEVRRHGYAPDTAGRVERRLQSAASTPSATVLRDELIALVAAESAAARPDERLPGSSEILESAFGQLKALEGDHQKGGFTGLLLSLGALVGRLDATTIGTALLKTPWKLVPKWLTENLGQTLASKRRETYQPHVTGAQETR